MSNRRSFLQRAFGLGAGILASSRMAAPQGSRLLNPAGGEAARALRGVRPAGPGFNVPVVTTDVGDLAHTLDGGVKVFELTAHVMRREIAPGKTIDVWGYNGSAPGPTIQVNQGDRVRVILHNRLPEPTSIHWHGFEDRIGFDGMPGISQEPVRPGGRFVYEFDIRQHGTFFYHSHMAMQEMAGMLGAFIMHPARPYAPHCDRDFVLHLQEYAVLPNNTVPNTMSMEFNWLLLNGKAGPAATPLIVRLGDRVRIRFVNLGMDHHPMHLHGHTFYVTGTEGGRIPEQAWWPGNTVLVGVAQARNVEFVADNPGDWMLHCHLPHHMMNQMASQAGPMTRRRGGMPAAGSMSNGMGMLDGAPGVPLGEQYGTAMGRGMGSGVAAQTINGPLSGAGLRDAMEGMPGQGKTAEPGMGTLPRRSAAAHDMASMDAQETESAPDAGDVPNFPQDAYMEGPMMTMDARVERPENYGLRPGWSRFMQGMMTFLRVLPPDKYDEVVARMRQAHRPGDPYAAWIRSEPRTHEGEGR